MKKKEISPKTEEVGEAEEIPNAETIAAIREADEGKTIGPFHSVEELMESLNADD